ncbi:hypothetical protein SAMN05216330_1342 [Bradyrhizobium sp. Ghvi]|nr:hypothetical protein SAMN05216330_1342 [Bradyrhizobium sp. Ghvi]
MAGRHPMLGNARIIEEAIGRLRPRPIAARGRDRLARCRRHLIKQAAKSARQSLVRQPCRNDFVVMRACSTGSRVSAICNASANRRHKQNHSGFKPDDGVFVQARMEDWGECMLVLIGATPGQEGDDRFSSRRTRNAQSRCKLLIDTRHLGLPIAPELADGCGAVRLLVGDRRSVPLHAAVALLGPQGENVFNDFRARCRAARRRLCRTSPWPSTELPRSFHSKHSPRTTVRNTRAPSIAF